ncbi:unnamed protein product [Cyclocybe aegerita]|uniref:PHD-type domain-containing protein n=1 Tax=Cyclocybe aegerita TaxID=1973307 RepID=A0A8S0XSB3_CYCAE|nr:unnamed protein product [Cyclocybe aegerita]
MKHGGFPVQEPPEATFKTHISGSNPVLPTGYSVIQAFYILRGGLAAQNKFFDLRVKAYSQRYHLKISPHSLSSPFLISSNDPNLSPMKHALRFWLTDPYKGTTVEYLTHAGIAVVTQTRPPREAPESEDSTSPPADPLRTVPPTTAPRDTQYSPTPSQAVSQISSLPDSEFEINCRCGMSGDGNALYRVEDGEAIQCDECKSWSHIACQRNGRAGNLRKKDPYLCDFCDLTHLLPGGVQEIPKRKSGRKKITLEDRLTSGCGALARNGDFWYPVRLIQKAKWKVRWWRSCLFMDDKIQPDSTTLVEQGDIVDELWDDRAARRQIRLGRWKHAHEIETSEDILADPTSIPFSNEVECALRPAEGVLRDLLLDPQVVDSNQVPAKRQLEMEKKPLTRTIVPEVGSLSLLDRAQVSNWFEINISKDPNLRQEWLAYLPIAHAHTVLIASRLRGYQVFQELTEVALIDRAWEVQRTGTPSVLIDVDVDRDSLERLEEQMFERSERAGVAGHYQWGLDSGDHQGGWDPYQGLPYHWNRGDRDGSEDEMQRGPNFIEVEMVSPVPQKKPRVRPRPIKVKSKMHTSRS